MFCLYKSHITCQNFGTRKMVAYVQKNVFLVCLMALLLLADLSDARFIKKITKSEIDSLCTRKGIDSSLCFEVLKSTPQIATLDFSGLAKYLINYDSRKTSDLLKQFQSLFNSTTDPSAKGSYQVCSETFGLAVSCFDSALEALATKDYDTLNDKAGCTLGMADTCMEELSSFKPNPQLVERVSIVENVSTIVLTILECYLRKEKIRCY